MVAIIQLAIALGAITGGWVFDRRGYQATFELSAAVLGAAAVLAWAAGRAAKPQRPTTGWAYRDSRPQDNRNLHEALRARTATHRT
jgi:hypothetical protein